MLGCPPRWGTLECQMVHFSAIAIIYREEMVPFSAIIRGTFVLTNIFSPETPCDAIAKAQNLV